MLELLIKEKNMREWVFDCWNSVMDHENNPLSNIPDFSTRHMIMQVLAGVISMMLHALLLAAVAVTVTTFETAKRKPNVFGAYNGRGNGGEHE